MNLNIFLFIILALSIVSASMPIFMSEMDGENDDHIQKKEKQKQQNAFISAFGSIFVSEIADKTFFLAMILAMSYNKKAVLVGTISALTIMTFISVACGFLISRLPK